MKTNQLHKYMTTNPHSIGDDQSLSKAAHVMEDLKIRHLPVLQAGKVVGVITDRDIKFALSLSGVDAEAVRVRDIAKEDVYLTSPFAELGEVVQNMASKRIGSAVVVDNGKLVGIFTAVDGLTALSEVLNTRHH